MSSGSDIFGGRQVSTKEMEQLSIKLMFEGKTSVKTVRESGCNCQVGTREYTNMNQRYYPVIDISRQRRDKKKIFFLLIIQLGLIGYVTSPKAGIPPRGSVELSATWLWP